MLSKEDILKIRLQCVEVALIPLEARYEYIKEFVNKSHSLDISSQLNMANVLTSIVSLRSEASLIKKELLILGAL